MEPAQPRDAWEQKTRAQFKEGDVSRRLFALATDPETPAPLLKEAAGEALGNYNNGRNFHSDACLAVLEALAQNPNTPPNLLGLLVWLSPFTCRAFCYNPITPLLLLEQPGFVADLIPLAQYTLLREADAPPLFVQMLATGNAATNEAVQIAARLHIALAGEAQSRNAWEQEVRDYWRGVCIRRQSTVMQSWDDDMREIGLVPTWAGEASPVPPYYSGYENLEKHLPFEVLPGEREPRTPETTADLLYLLRKPGGLNGLTRLAILKHPTVNADVLRELAAKESQTEWMEIVNHPQTPPDVLVRILESRFANLRRLARRHKNSPPNAREIGQNAFIHHARKPEQELSPFAAFVASTHGPHHRPDLSEKAEHHEWTERLEAVFYAENRDAPLPGDGETRTGRDLLHHLSRDGNRLVRWAAQTRLQNPDFVFRWQNDG